MACILVQYYSAVQFGACPICPELSAVHCRAEPFLFVDFFAGLQIFCYAGCDFLQPEELAPHAKNDACGY